MSAPLAVLLVLNWTHIYLLVILDKILGLVRTLIEQLDHFGIKNKKFPFNRKVGSKTQFITNTLFFC